MNKFRILLRDLSVDQEDETLKNYYSSWRKTNKAKKEPFFAIYKGFKEQHLASLDPGPLRLYLYFGFFANNEQGSSWPSIKTIADFFGTQQRTINNWIAVLVEKGLIYRTRKGKRSHTTYLIPYSDTLIRQTPRKTHETDNQDVLDDLVSSIESHETVFGSIQKVHHLFHWGTGKSKKPSISTNTQWLFIITKRVDDVYTGHYYPLRKSEHLGIEVLEADNISIFQSPFIYNQTPVTGIAFHQAERFLDTKNTKEIIEVMRSLAAATTDDLKEHPKTAYGEITNFFEPDSDTTADNTGMGETE